MPYRRMLKAKIVVVVMALYVAAVCAIVLVVADTPCREACVRIRRVCKIECDKTFWSDVPIVQYFVERECRSHCDRVCDECRDRCRGERDPVTPVEPTG